MNINRCTPANTFCIICLLCAAVIIGPATVSRADSSTETAQTATATQANPFAPYFKADNPRLKFFNKLPSDQQQQVLTYFEQAKQQQGLTQKQVFKVLKAWIDYFSLFNQYSVFIAWFAQRPDAPYGSPVNKEWLKREPQITYSASITYALTSIKDEIPAMVTDDQIKTAEKMSLTWESFKEEQIAESEREIAKSRREIAESEREIAESRRRIDATNKLIKALESLNELLEKNQ